MIYLKTLTIIIWEELMKDIIKYVVECHSMYRMVCVICAFVCFYISTIFIVYYLYKCLSKICNTIITYNDIHTKAEFGYASIKADLYR